MAEKRKRAETPATADKVAAPPKPRRKRATASTAPANGNPVITDTDTYQPIQRTEAEWLELHRPKMQQVFDLWKAGEYKKARFLCTQNVRPLRKNAVAARKSPTGTHGSQHYDAIAKALENTLRLCREHPGIIRHSGADPLKTSDTTEGQDKVSKPPLPSVADNAETTNAVDINDTVSSPVRTIEKESTNEKFTIAPTQDAPYVPDSTSAKILLHGEANAHLPYPYFRCGDALTIPNHWGRTYEVKDIIEDEDYSETYYGFCTLHADAFIKDGAKHSPVGYYKYYRESQLIALNPEMKSISARQEIARKQGKAEMISAAYLAIREAISSNNSETLKTAMHEFAFWWRSLYGAGEVNPADVALFIAGEVPIQMELIGGAA